LTAWSEWRSRRSSNALAPGARIDCGAGLVVATIVMAIDQTVVG
jgi:hypothetical protein